MSFLSGFRFARPSELGGQAIDGAGDTHLARGVHLRVEASPDLGLPVEPFEAVRVSLGPGRDWPGVRNDVEWIDARGQKRTEPFTVEPDNPVCGYFPTARGAQCCWVRVDRPRVGPGLPVFPVRPPLVAHALGPTTPGRDPRGLGRAPATFVQPTRPERPAVAAVPAAPTGSLSVRAFMQTAMGPAAIAVRSRAPFELAATPIEWIEVRGAGVVNGVAWLDARALLDEIVRRLRLPATDPDHMPPWRSLSLPVTDDVRYTGAPSDAPDQADERVAEGAPTRFGLHDVPDVAGPSASPPVAGPSGTETAIAEVEAIRLSDVTPALGEYLQQLVSTEAPEEVVDSAELEPPAEGIFTISILNAVLGASSDPGVARWMGLSVVDRAPPTDASGHLVAYALVGGFIPRVGEHRRTQRLATVLCAVVGHPGDRPPPPFIDEPQGGGFMPIPPPDAQRVVHVRVGNLVPGAGLAIARRLGSEVTGLNERAPSGRAIPFAPHAPDDAETFGESELTDRSAPPEAFVYRAAQHDWFGRWSEWTERAAAAAERPAPAPPVLQATYAPPDVGNPFPLGPLSGTISVRVPVPPIAALAPGGRLLDRLVITVDGTLHEVPLADPSEPPAELQPEIAGPPIERAGERTVTVVGRWVDQAGVASEPSPPRTLTLLDPRPAPHVALPPGLRYTSRPDATGRARFRLEWTGASSQAFFRAYYSDETRLVRGLEELAAAVDGAAAERASQALDVLGDLRDPADRAAVFEGAHDLFGRELFEQLTAEPIASAGLAATTIFEHALPAALQVLSFYRIVAISKAQVESPFADAPFIPVRIPNTLTASRPTLTVRPRVDPGSGAPEAELTVEVPLGNVAPTEFRIRRSVDGAFDVNGMPVVETGALHATPEGRHRATALDRGSAPFGGSLRPWVRYVWCAEVRGPDESGAGPTAEWSPPSAPVAQLFVPPRPPAPPEVESLEVTSTGVVLRFRHPEPLDGALAKGYSLEVYRQLPGERARLLDSIPAGAAPAAGGRDASGAFHARDEPTPPAGTAYRVLARDPLGRASGATEPAFVTEGDDA